VLPAPQRRGEPLRAWMDQIDTHRASALRSFVRRLRSDLDAGAAGLILAHNSGLVGPHHMINHYHLCPSRVVLLPHGPPVGRPS